MATRSKRRTRTRPKPKPNSQIRAAQKSAFQRTEERKQKRDEAIVRQMEAEKRTGGRTGASGQTELRAPQGPVTQMQRGVDQKAVSERDSGLGRAIAEAGRKTSGLVTIAENQAREQEKRALADTSLYGNPAKLRQQRLNEMKMAQDAARTKQLANKGNAVYMGPGTLKVTGRGPERLDPDAGGSRYQTVTAGDNIMEKDQLLAWLADPAKVEQIKAQALAAGLNVESYDDIDKLWQSVVSQAATTFSTTGKKVTPMALIALRGKHAVGGRMAEKVTTSTTIEEMDPAQARLMFDKVASDYLGRAAREDEVDDFIAKAQTIAKQNPLVTTTRSSVGFDGQVEQGNQVSTSKGGADDVAAQAQVAAQQMAKQDEEYASYQAAGVYFPLLFEALSSPV